MRKLDLNLLYTLRELIKEPNTTRVGEKLGLTQSAVSAALNRLRWTFQDKLLVRSGRAMALTKRAEDLLEPVEEILVLVEQLVAEFPFDPKEMQRTFAITSAEPVLSKLACKLVPICQAEAPGVTFRFESATVDTRARMRSGHLDLAIAPVASIEVNLRQISTQLLYKDRLVCVVSKNSTHAKRGVTQQQFMDASHAIVRPDIAKHEILTTAELFLKDLGLKTNTVIDVTSYAVLPSVLIGSELIATVPMSFGSELPEQDSIKLIQFPFDSGEIEVCMIWNSALGSDPGHEWLRTMVADILSENPDFSD